MSLRSASTGFLGAIIGGAMVWIGQAGSFSLRPVGMSYADLAATLLSAVGVIVAIFGGVLALAALWGFNQLKRDAIAAERTPDRPKYANRLRTVRSATISKGKSSG